MFTRPQKTYTVDPAAVGRILGDRTSPLRCIAELIPAAGTVLDIGAGNGLLADVLAAMNKKPVIDGIEPSSFAAAIARPKYSRFYSGYAQDYVADIRAAGHDFIVLADVLEHAADPLELLTMLASASKPAVKILVSVPNCAFGSVALSLLDGRFPYADSGLLERTHLRFFTIHTLRGLAAAAGMNIEKLVRLRRDMLKTELRPRLHWLDFPTFLRLAYSDHASVYQYVAVLTKEDCACSGEERGHRIRWPVLRFLGAALRRRRGRERSP